MFHTKLSMQDGELEVNVSVFYGLGAKMQNNLQRIELAEKTTCSKVRTVKVLQ